MIFFSYTECGCNALSTHSLPELPGGCSGVLTLGRVPGLAFSSCVGFGKFTAQTIVTTLSSTGETRERVIASEA